MDPESVVFPLEDKSNEDNNKVAATNHTRSGSAGKRTLSELLKMHAEKGTKCAFSQEEANRVGDVLGQWVCVVSVRHAITNQGAWLITWRLQINSSSSPYEGDDEEFFGRGKDDLCVPSRRIGVIVEGRQRGMSASGTFIHPSAVAVAAAAAAAGKSSTTTS